MATTETMEGPLPKREVKAQNVSSGKHQSIEQITEVFAKRSPPRRTARATVKVPGILTG